MTLPSILNMMERMAFSQTHCSQKQLSHVLTERTTLPLPVINTTEYLHQKQLHSSCTEIR